MNSEQLDAAYTALCQAMARVGEAAAPQFLAMLTLSLMARMNDSAAVLELIERAEAASHPETG